jgi:NDP-sugar pyrophosphorylase family protein
MSIMHAIIFADRNRYDLAPFTQHRPVAMLPIGNKPLIDITIEELFGVGVRTATILTTTGDNSIENHIGTGSRWGMRIDHISSNIPFKNLTAIARSVSDIGNSWITVRGDMLRPFGLLEEALKRGQSQSSADIYTALGIALPSGGEAGITGISWDNVSATCRLHPCLIDTPSTYHSANVMALSGLVPGVRTAGRPTPDHIMIGVGTKVLFERAPARSVVIGKNCLIEKGVELGPFAVIGDEAIIDKGATIRNSIIMPGTYVGRGVSISDSIVDGAYIYCVKRQVLANFSDHRIVAGHGPPFSA